MFGIFKKKSTLDKLYAEYKRALTESKRLSTTDRKASDAHMTKASEVLKEIERQKAIQ